MVKLLIKKTPLYRPLAKLYDWLNFNVAFIKEVIRILFLPRDIKTFFFFPFYHTGGAELVHLNIVKAIQHKTLTFFTVLSANDHFLSTFQQHSDCHIIEKMIRSRWRKKLLFRCISFKINHQRQTNVFGCHSLFFYELLPYLRKDIKCTDLIHAFTHTDEPGFEKMSLPYVNRLDQRVTISEKGKNDLIEQYNKNNIDYSLKDRIQVIYNTTEFVCAELQEKPSDVFNVVYVGRNSPEKRIPLIGKIATQLKQIDSTFRIILVGENLVNGVNIEDRDSCIFAGTITEPKELEDIYRTAHVVVITSTREGIPMALVEGMVFGAVPVATNVGGIAELIEQDVIGKLIPYTVLEETQKDLFLKEIKQLKEDTSLFNLCCDNSFMQAKQKFTKTHFSQKYTEIIKS